MVEWKNLGVICEIKGRIGFRGYTREDQVEKGEGAISLSPGNIDGGSLNFESCTYITWEKYEESPEIMAFNGDIILGKTASVGKVALVKNLPEKATINPQLVLLKNITINPYYLYYVLSDAPFQKTIKRLAGIGSVPNVSQAKLAQITIPVPSETEQSNIVNKLDTFTSSIENLKEQIAQRRKQYEYYRDQLLDLEGKEGVEMKRLGDIGKCVAGATPSTKVLEYWEGGNIPWMSSGEVHQKIVTHTASFITQKGYENASTKMLPIGTIVIALAGQGKTRGSVAITAIELCTNQSICGVIINDTQILNKYVYYYMLTRYNDLRRISSGDGTRGGLNLKMISSYYIPLPPLSEQQRIVDILDKFEASIQNLEAQLSQREKQYEYYRNKLLTFE